MKVATKLQIRYYTVKLQERGSEKCARKQYVSAFMNTKNQCHADSKEIPADSGLQSSGIALFTDIGPMTLMSKLSLHKLFNSARSYFFHICIEYCQTIPGNV